MGSLFWDNIVEVLAVGVEPSILGPHVYSLSNCAIFFCRECESRTLKLTGNGSIKYLTYHMIFVNFVWKVFISLLLSYHRRTCKMVSVSVTSSSRAPWRKQCIYFSQSLLSSFFTPYRVLASLFSMEWLLSVCRGENETPSLRLIRKLTFWLFCEILDVNIFERLLS